MANNEGYRRYIEAAAALGQITRARAEEIVRQMASGGEMQREQAQQWVDDLIDRSRRATEDVFDFVRSEVTKQLDALGLDPEQLAHQAAEILRRSAKAAATKTAATKTAATKTAATKTAATKTAATKTAATKTAAKKAGAKKAGAGTKATATKATATKATATKATATKATATKATATKAAATKTAKKAATPGTTPPAEHSSGGS